MDDWWINTTTYRGLCIISFSITNQEGCRVQPANGLYGQSWICNRSSRLLYVSLYPPIVLFYACSFCVYTHVCVHVITVIVGNGNHLWWCNAEVYKSLRWRRSALSFFILTLYLLTSLSLSLWILFYVLQAKDHKFYTLLLYLELETIPNQHCI